VESSPAESTPTAGDDAAAPVSDVNETAPAASSESTDGKTEGSVVDAVVSALRPKTDGEGSPASQTPDSTKAEDPAKAQAEELSDDVTAEELADQKPKTRKRIEQLLGKVKTLSTERDAMSSKVAEFDKFVGFIAKNNLTQEDVNSIFEIGALVRSNDPAAALEKLTPVYQQLQKLAGVVLPPDLDERVRLGYIAEPDARELHRSRTEAKLAQQRQSETERKATEDREQERRSGIVRDVSSAISSWETAKKTSDPDWHLKAQRIDQRVRLEVYEKGYPETKDAAVKMINSIYDEVTKEIRGLVPKAPAKSPAVAGGSSTSTVAEPKSLLDAIRIGMNAA
jgi:hypothetical protein